MPLVYLNDTWLGSISVPKEKILFLPKVKYLKFDRSSELRLWVLWFCPWNLPEPEIESDPKILNLTRNFGTSKPTKFPKKIREFLRQTLKFHNLLLRNQPLDDQFIPFRTPINLFMHRWCLSVKIWIILKYILFVIHYNQQWVLLV